VVKDDTLPHKQYQLKPGRTRCHSARGVAENLEESTMRDLDNAELEHVYGAGNHTCYKPTKSKNNSKSKSKSKHHSKSKSKSKGAPTY